jgi:hypothetical protein
VETASGPTPIASTWTDPVPGSTKTDPPSRHSLPEGEARLTPMDRRGRPGTPGDRPATHLRRRVRPHRLRRAAVRAAAGWRAGRWARCSRRPAPPCAWTAFLSPALPTTPPPLARSSATAVSSKASETTSTVANPGATGSLWTDDRSVDARLPLQLCRPCGPTQAAPRSVAGVPGVLLGCGADGHMRLPIASCSVWPRLTAPGPCDDMWHPGRTRTLLKPWPGATNTTSIRRNRRIGRSITSERPGKRGSADRP